jgi:type I restriction enzyme S subunit
MFGDPVSNPMNWKPRKVGDEVETMQYGPRFYNEVYSPTGVRIIRITDLDSLGNLSFENMPMMEVSDSDIKCYGLKQGDLIFARSGATVGKTALIPENAPVCIAGAYFITMRFKKTVNPVFARNLFASKPVQAIIEQKSRQSAQQNFSGPGLRDLPLPLPPLPLQEKFAAIVRKSERIRRQQREATRQAEHLFQTLLHRAFRGDL